MRSKKISSSCSKTCVTSRKSYRKKIKHWVKESDI